MGWLRKKAKQIGKGIKKIGSKIAGAVRKVTRTKAFKVIAAIALATIVGPAAWSTWGAGGSGTFMANLSAQTAAVTGGAFGSTLAQQQAAASAANVSTQLAATVPTAFSSGTAAVPVSSFASGTGAAGTQTAASAFSAGTSAVPVSSFASGTAAAGTGSAASQLAVTVPSSLTPILNEAAAATAANVNTANVFTRVGQGIQNFAEKNPFVSSVAGSVVGGVTLGAIQAKLAGDPELQGVQVGESAQERSALAELYSGYQAQYGNNASKEYMLGMNFGYDSVGYQTTA